MDLLSNLSRTSTKKAVDPREIFMTLPARGRQYEYPRDVQSEVWKKWFEKREQKNTVIKMNTGSGKTVVGLMILQSCLNEGKGPAVYVVPDRYLVAQVCNEAEKLGILVTKDKDDYVYTVKKAILVITIHQLVNGKSAFGINSNYHIGSVLIDDVHACMDTIASQFSLRIPYGHPLYDEMLKLFEAEWKFYNENEYIDIIEMQNPAKNALLPFWVWQKKQQDVYRLLKRYDNDAEENKFVFFNLPLISDCLGLCNCVITTNSIEITPKGISISKITSFDDAKRRIFMSATLADDSIFASALGLKKDDISNIITPDKANDIGDRLILFPQHLNSKITDDEIKEKVTVLSKQYNVLVIVPSWERGRFWDDTEQNIIDKGNIEDMVKKLKQEHVGLVILVNRYDGVDLPDDACRLLVLDGLPPLQCEYDKYVQSINPAGTLKLREQMQKIEQGMGRGIRSSSDSCCIVLMGSRLSDVLLREDGESFFSSATQEQYQLSKDLWENLKAELSKKSGGEPKPENVIPSLDDIFEMAEYSLKRDVEWITKSKERLSTVVYNTTPNISDTTLALRMAFEFADIGQWKEAANEISNAVNKESDKKSRGYLMQIKAEYINVVDKSKAQEILTKARNYNKGLLVPIEGIQYDKSIKNREQANGIKKYFSATRREANTWIIHINSVLDSLSFSPEAYEFERALMETGNILGFDSTRPDQLTSGKGPDNLWAIGDSKYLVIECKSGAKGTTISKDYCNQLGGSQRWFQEEYGNAFKSVPVMVHPSNALHSHATPVENMRVITPELLDKMKKQIKDFTVALVQSQDSQDEERINSLLLLYKLRGRDIVSEYTVEVK